MSPAQPPRPGPGGKPGPAGGPGPGPGKPPAGAKPAAPPPKPAAAPPKPAPPAAGKPKKELTHLDDPAHKAGKYFEIRKGTSGSHERLKEKEEEEDAPIMNVALPRSITQEQEQEDLKQRLGREELIDIDKRDARVKVKETAAGPGPNKNRSNGLWLLVLVALIAVAAIIADKMHLLDKLKG